MANIAQRFAGGGVNAAGVGAAAWTNANAINRSDGEGASLADNITTRAANVTLNANQSNWLVLTGFRFDQLFDPVPAGATIKGVQVRLQGGALNGYTLATFAAVRLVVGGSVVGATRGAGVPVYPAQDLITEELFGNRDADELTFDLWGLSLTAGDVRAADFGVAISVQAPGACTVGLDSVQIRVYWEMPFAAVMMHSGDTGTAPFAFFADAMMCRAGSAQFQDCEARWTVDSPPGWSKTVIDRRPGADVNGKVRDCATDMVGYAAGWNFDVAGTYTITLTWVAPDGTTDTDTVVVSVASPSSRAVRYVDTAGANSNSGTSAGAAWATLDHAIRTAPSGSFIRLKDDQTHQFTGGVFGASAPIRDLVIERSGSGTAPPTINFTGVMEANNIDRLMVRSGIRITGVVPFSFYAADPGGSRPCKKIVLEDLQWGSITSLFELGDLGASQCLLLFNCGGGPTQRYVTLPGQFSEVIHVGGNYTLSPTNPAEGALRYQGHRTSDPLAMGGHANWAYWTTGGSDTATQSLFRGATAYGGSFQCHSRGLSQGNINFTDVGTPQIFGSHTHRVDGYFANNGWDVQANHISVVNSIFRKVSGQGPCPIRGRGEKVRLLNCTLITKALDSSGVVRAIEVKRHRERQLEMENCRLILDGTAASWEASYREQLNGSGDVFAAGRYVKRSRRNSWPLLAGTRFYLFDGGVKQYTFAQWRTQPWVTNDIEVAESEADAPASRNFAPASDSPVATGGAPVPGVLRDYRGVARNGSATTWAIGATGMEPLADGTPAAPVLNTPTALSEGLRFTWTTVSGTQGYTLYLRQGTVGPFSVMPFAIGAGDTQVDVAGLVAGAAYQAYLTAFNASGESAPSNIVSGVPGFSASLAARVRILMEE